MITLLVKFAVWITCKTVNTLLWEIRLFANLDFNSLVKNNLLSAF